MAQKTNIEWAEATWNPWHGCHKVSAGCKNCYMFREKKQYGQDPNTVVRSKTKFYDPLKWKDPMTIFTCSWSDFFIEEADPWRDEAFAIMALTPQHTYQVLTKRPERMLEYLRGNWQGRLIPHLRRLGRVPEGRGVLLETRNMMLPNVWLGISAEDRETYITRVPFLALMPPATKFLSFEPLLGDVGDLMLDGIFEGCYQWAIVGGESGPDARPMHPDWARSIRDQCQAAGVPFFFKQWGEWANFNHDLKEHERLARYGTEDVTMWPDGTIGPGNMIENRGLGQKLFRVGKKKAGRILDGRTWDEMPEVT